MNATQTASSLPRPVNVLKKTLGDLLPSALHPRTLLRKRMERATRDAVVLGGPFAGMRYVGESIGSMWWPKVLGTYEKELANVIRELSRLGPAWVIDIGAAEGYYAVGMAWLCPDAQVISFEGEESGRKLQTELAALNGVSARLHIKGFGDHDAFRAAVIEAGGGVIICDIEGGERALLDPSAIPELVSARWTLLIEIHDHIYPDITETLITRFRATHSIEEIVTHARHAHDLPPAVQCAFLKRWTPPYLDERRPGPMRWLLLRPTA